ncbi:hypothetical protein LF887_15825 [Chryseobacterium sp. MEBOG06]|uniref:hypothetical protein n=1 Tax=unclassified Chryseobacterium TaxID=2593645 RepID=UPI001F46D27C|nr:MULTISPECIES: hypothetical protein [unclassified Chryseobacterium]UKB82471.1 hypothetical protein LF887_15825 [Chryseobacterium sp. MEBOG06]
MKKIIFLFAFFCFMLGFSQENVDKGYFPVKYILKSSSDTIKAKVRNIGKFTNKKYSFATIVFKMKIRDNAGNETWIQPSDVKYIKITDENNINHEYYASSDKLPKDQGLVEIIYEGNNINWYRSFYNSALSIGLEIREHVIDKSKKKIYGFTDLSKSVFKKIFKDYPDLIEKLESAKTEKDCINLLQLYDAKIDKI